MKTEYFFGDHGPVYFHPDLSVFGIGSNIPAPVEEKTPIVAKDVVDYFHTLLKTYKETEAKLNEAKKALREAMDVHNVKSFDFGSFSASISADSTSTSFDSKAFKKDHPELYKKYATSKAKKGSFTIKLKDND